MRAETVPRAPISEDALWYQDAIIYELHVRAFCDSDADGIGDFRGLIQKLDYLQDLGVTAVWLLPFYPSPLKDDGYDSADYINIHPAYGTLRDFKLFLREARRQGLRVITELVLNHTSDQHPWFQRARRAKPGTSLRDFYVWAKAPNRYPDARIIFKDFESSNWAWDQIAGEYFWHRFYSHQPDLNWDNPHVRRAMFGVLDFWLEMGVDGLRLDAVPYLFEREGTNCENLPETHALLKELHRHVDRRFPNRMLLAEANQWPEDAIAYFGSGDECNMAFHFPLMPRMFMALRMEDRFPIIDILAQTPPIPDTCQWALFLRNHDELTLEMVTDEDRDYMYRVYAQERQARINLGIRRRLAPLLGNNRRMIETINGLLFSLPGTPVIYYGDEIGMGDNIYLGDRNGVRTPMQWSADRNAGFSQANPQKLYLPTIIDPEYHAGAINVEAQQQNSQSLLWWMKRLVALRKRYKAFGRGSLEMLYPENRKILAFVRSYGEERILVVANLSRLAQYVELDLSPFRGAVPIELFGGTDFPPVSDRPYFLTLGPHTFYWFALQPGRAEARAGRVAAPPLLKVAGDWREIFSKKNREALEELLPSFLVTRRWFGGKARRIRSVEIVELVPVAVPNGAPSGYLTLLRVEYTDGDPDLYLLPLAATSARRSREEEALAPAAVARLSTKDGDQLLYDAVWDPDFCSALLEALAGRRRLAGISGKVTATPTRAFRPIRGQGPLAPYVMQAEQSNSSIGYGDRLLLKLFRRLGEGENPDLEIGRFLTERTVFPHIPPVAGALEYRRGRGEPVTLGILHGFAPNQGDAWSYTLDSLGRFAERVLVGRPESEELTRDHRPHLLDMAAMQPSPAARELIGEYLESARLIGERTGGLHTALASEPDHPSFAPEPFTPFYQRSTYESMRALTLRTFRLLRERTDRHPEAVQVLDLEAAILKRFRALLETRITATRIRCHGDYHLGQVLFTGRDFLIIDFEGEPARSLGERRIKRSPIRDVAGMIRSFHYAAFALLYGHAGAIVRPDDPSILEPWLHFWYRWVSASFLRAYLHAAAGASFLPPARGELEVLLDAFLLEKALYELAYEANNRPDWIKLPIQGILDLVED